MTYKQGDILIDKDGDERKVLGVCGEVYFLSAWDNFEKTGAYNTIKDLNEWGYTLKSFDTVKEMTVADIEKVMGCKVKVIK